jgi:hypothetical protein
MLEALGPVRGLSSGKIKKFFDRHCLRFPAAGEGELVTLA